MSRPLNYTTRIPVIQTVAECSAILADAGASAVAIEYADRRPAGLSFRLDTPHGRREFTLPVDTGSMRAVLLKAEAGGQFAAARKAAGTYSSPEHAASVAWRVCKDWLQANLALIAAQMATLDQVMLPYLVVGDEGHTLYQEYRAGEQVLGGTPSAAIGGTRD